MYDFLPPIFAGLADADIQTALQRFKTVDVDAGVRLIEEGDEDPTLVVVHTGELEVRTGDTVLGKAGAGELLGEMALFAGGIRSASVTSLSRCKLLVLDWDNYDYLRRARHPVAFAIEDSALESLSDRLRAVGDRIAALAEGTPVEHVTPSRGFFDRVASAFGSGGVMAPPRIDGAAVLARSPLFAGTVPEVLAEVAAHFVPMAARRGHFLCTEGETGNDMYVIASGAVDVLVATGDDKVEPVATLEPGEAFGMCALVQPAQPRMASCVAREKVSALTMGKIAWAEVATRGDMVGSTLRVAMIRALCDQLAYANGQLALLAHNHDLKRLARAGAGVEAHGHYLAEDDDLPEYLKGVDQPW